MISQPTRAKRRYTFMRQEIIQAARQIIKEQGIDGLSMRTIAHLVHTSPANLYEYFLNKEEIIFSVYNDVLSNLLATLQLVNHEPSGRAHLLTLCVHYIDFIGQDPSQLQIVSYPFRVEITAQQQRTGIIPPPTETAAANKSPSLPSAARDGAVHLGESERQKATYAIGNNYVDPSTAAYMTNAQDIFELFLQAVERCIEEGAIAPSSMTASDTAHVIWAFVHGLITLRVQEISTIDRETMHAAIAKLIDGLAT